MPPPPNSLGGRGSFEIKVLPFIPSVTKENPANAVADQSSRQ